MQYYIKCNLGYLNRIGKWTDKIKNAVSFSSRKMAEMKKTVLDRDREFKFWHSPGSFEIIEIKE